MHCCVPPGHKTNIFALLISIMLLNVIKKKLPESGATIQCIHNFLELKIMILTGDGDCAVTAILMKKHPFSKIKLNVLVILHKTWTCLFFPTQILSCVQHRCTTQMFIHTKATVFYSVK